MSLHKELIDIIDIRIKEFLKNFIYINEKEGMIVKLADNNGKYTVKIDNVQYLISKKENDTTIYEVGDIVIVRLFNGNFSRKYIECKKPNW